jgi:hypothetical protein
MKDETLIKDETLDALTHGLIQALSVREISERQSQRLLQSCHINIEQLRELLPKEPKPFDIEEIRDETHLREIVMERVLDTALHNITTAGNDGNPSMPLADLPEEQQTEALNKVMLEFLDSNKGPGPLLRSSIAMMIISYRMRNRLKELLSTLNSSSFKAKRVREGIAHIEKMIRSGMFYFECWTFYTNDSAD